MSEPVYFIVKAVPALCLNPNRSRSHHWTDLSRAIAALRESACWDIREMGRPRTFEGPVDVWACICWPSRKRLLKDTHNCFVMLKPVWDGMTDAGVWLDDDQVTVRGVEQFVMTKIERLHYPNGCIVVAVQKGVKPVTVAPIDKHGHVTQAWLDGIPRF